MISPAQRKHLVLGRKGAGQPCCICSTCGNTESSVYAKKTPTAPFQTHGFAQAFVCSNALSASLSQQLGWFSFPLWKEDKSFAIQQSSGLKAISQELCKSKGVPLCIQGGQDLTPKSLADTKVPGFSLESQEVIFIVDYLRLKRGTALCNPSSVFGIVLCGWGGKKALLCSLCSPRQKHSALSAAE